MLLKLDFAKAFDTVEHDLILLLLKYQGFDDKWISWIKELLSSGSSSIMLNGVPRKQFNYKRGVRQGDPLSPFLFNLVFDALATILDLARRAGHIRGICPHHTGGGGLTHLQYADDTIIILSAVEDQLVALKNMLHIF